MPLQAQFLIDFETEASSVAIEGTLAAIVDNPDKKNNPSEKSAYYKKVNGNWKPFYIVLSEGVNVGNNDRLSYKVRTSTKGRVYIKIWNGDQVLKESWVRNYEYMPDTDTWTDLTYDVSELKNKTITLIELVASVDNNAEADVYYDDIRLFNSAAPNGEPLINLAYESPYVMLGDTFKIDASASVDLEGTIDEYQWDMGDGTIITGSSKVNHVYQEKGLYNLVLTIMDNDGNSSKATLTLWVFEEGEASSPLFNIQEEYRTNEKIELGFLIKKQYDNPNNPDEVEVNARVRLPDGQVRIVPCFYYQEVEYMQSNWKVVDSEQFWMLRLSTLQAGVHQVQIECSDPNGSFISDITEINVIQGDKKGIIHQDEQNHQFFRHETSEPFYPMGINMAWDNIENYTTVAKNLSEGGANLFRYWHAAFTNQVLEWENGLGNYSPIAAAKQDSLLELCEKNNIYLQMCIFHHGMFSQTVNSNWSESPYRNANGGPLSRPEEFFYNETAKTYAKRLLRYIVARWGYAPELFAWELFNEVQWTGNHPNQSSRWREEVIEWHDEMGQYLKSIDPFNHIVTTSADDQQLIELAGRQGIDLIQYHTYPAGNIINELVNKDQSFLAATEETAAAVFCGEYGYANDGDVPFNEQRLAIWTGLMSRVPHMIWRWQVHYNSNWTALFKNPSAFVGLEDFVADGEVKNWEFNSKDSGQNLKTLGFKSASDQYYGLVYDENLSNNITTATIDLSKIKFGLYQLEMQDIVSGNSYMEEIEVERNTIAYPLPLFSHALALKAKYVGELEYLLAFAGEDKIIGLGQESILSSLQSNIPSGIMPGISWSIIEQPVGSELELPKPDSAEMIIVPDLPGQYTFQLSLSDGQENRSRDTVSLFVSDNPVAIAGEDVVVEPGDRLTLNGRSSYDPEGDRIAYQWSLLEKPENSLAELQFSTSSRPILQTDLEGVYTVELIVWDGYSYSKPDTLLVKAMLSTSLTDLTPVARVKVFPNPSVDYINVDLRGFSLEKGLISILDLNGKVWVRKKIGALQLNEPYRINLKDLGLAAGTYFIQIRDKHKKVSTPFEVIWP